MKEARWQKIGKSHVAYHVIGAVLLSPLDVRRDEVTGTWSGNLV